MTDQDSFFIPSSYSRIIARELGLQEKDLGRLLRGTDLDTDILLPGDETRLTGQQQLRVLENARRMLNAPEFGLRLGRQLQPSSHGPLGYLVLSSPDLITALESLRDFLPVRLPIVQLEIHTEPDWIVCSIRSRLQTNAEEWRVMQDCFAMVIQSVAESVLGRNVTEARIGLEHAKPGYHALYNDYLHSPVNFVQSGNAYRLPITLARAPNTTGDPESYALTQQLCLKLMDQIPGKALSNSDRVRRVLLSQPGGSVTEVDIARSMYVSKRTLARRLESEGTSYRAIRESIFSDLAARHLRESGLSVESVATLLGYSDTAAFRKAFRRWYGCSPGKFRAESAATPSQT
jgi:AraC-like DNA-binding protein